MRDQHDALCQEDRSGQHAQQRAFLSATSALAAPFDCHEENTQWWDLQSEESPASFQEPASNTFAADQQPVVYAVKNEPPKTPEPAHSTESAEQSVCSTAPCTPTNARFQGIMEAVEVQHAIALDAPAAVGKDESPSHRGKPKKWSTMQKQKHSDACRRKERLTLADKLEIIFLYESAPPDERKSQVRTHLRSADRLLLTCTFPTPPPSHEKS